jgi:hypothetical protein
LGGLVSRGAEDQESNGHQTRGNSGRCERTRGGNKASKQVKLAVGAILPLVTQGNQEAGLRTRGKGTYSSRGIQATASKAWASVKPRVIRSLAVRSAAQWITAREQSWPREGYTLFARGTLWREVVQERLRHETRPWNSVKAKTAERLRKPESGPVVSLDSS